VIPGEWPRIHIDRRIGELFYRGHLLNTGAGSKLNGMPGGQAGEAGISKRNMPMQSDDAAGVTAGRKRMGFLK
jgi:hypothetical protein